LDRLAQIQAQAHATPDSNEQLRLFPFLAQHVKNISAQNKQTSAAQGNFATIIDAVRALDVTGMAKPYLDLAQDQLC
jgi:hypothetical protein